MSATWRSQEPPPESRIGVPGWLIALPRGLVLALTVFGGLALLLALRLVERPVFGLHRPVTPWITRAVCRAAFAILGIGFTVQGRPMADRGALVANHSSWLDILALNAADRVYFVSKSEVAGWPGIGWLARATGTVFINRRGREAQVHKLAFEARLRAGHRLLFFPEGTSSDGMRVLPFKSTLFAAFFERDLKNVLQVQAATVFYRAPEGVDPRFYGWWGEMGFFPHMLRVLAQPRQGEVRIIFHPPLAVADFPDRKALAIACETAVRSGYDTAA